MKLLVILLSGLFSTGAVAAQDIMERQDADPTGEIEVSNVAGEVRVSGWDENVIEITGSLGKGVKELEFVRDGDHTSIRVVHEKNHSHVEASHLTIKIPKGSELGVTTVSADIEVALVTGIQRLQSVSGDITAEVFDSALDAMSVSGDLQISGHDARMNSMLKTISGDVDITGIGGEVEATTISGDVTIATGMLSRVRLQSTSGRLVVEAGLEAEGRIDLSTTNGRVKVMLDNDVDLDVDVETLSGKIHNCFDIDSTRQHKYGPGYRLRFRYGEASRRVRIRSLSGSVDVCSQTTSG